MRTGCLALVVVVGVLLVAQAIRLRPAGLQPSWALVGPAVVALLEPALPLVALFAAGLTYGRLRREGAWVALAALGVGPARRVLPAVALGVGVGMWAAFIASAPGPQAVATLRTRLLAAWTDRGLPAGGLRLPEGGRLDVGSDAQGVEVVWGAWPTPKGTVVLRGEQPRLRADATGAQLELGHTWVWTPEGRIEVAATRLALGPEALHRRLATLGAPNDLPSSALDPTDRRQAFVGWRRIALPALAPLWALLGALLGAGLGPRRAVVAGAVVVVGAAWLLRTGELAARSGLLAPWVAAWLPVVMVACLTAWVAVRLKLD